MGIQTSLSDKKLQTTESTQLPIDDFETMETYLENDEVSLIIKLKEKLGQNQLFQHTHTHQIKSILDDIMSVENTYVGGIEGYINNAKKLLKESAEGVNKFKGCKVEMPKTFSVNLFDENYLHIEKMGLDELEYCSFVLVAGGLGERLGYSDIKIKLPSETITHTPYIELYISYLLAYQNYIFKTKGTHIDLPFAIMTSDDTHTQTVKLLEEHSNFGLKQNQITLIKQGRVPTLIDNEAHMTLTKTEPFKLDMKPHGHGDVHTLLLQSGLIDEWVNKGKKWVFFFQDTNGLSFSALPSFLGISFENNLAMNFLAIPRFPDDAVGTVCDIIQPDHTHLTMNIEYNVLDGLFKENNIDKYQTDNKGYSVYPGNSNILLFDLHTYAKILKQTSGSVPEFVNPKYADSTKTTFKSPTRLECMMQDFAQLFSSEDKVGCTQMEREMSFSPLKNNIKDAAIKFKNGQNAECAFTAESDQFNCAAKFLLAAAHYTHTPIEIEEPKVYTFEGIEYKMGPQIVLKPSWAMSVQTIMEKLGPGKIFISNNSTLIVEENVYIDGLTLNGSVHLKPQSDLQLIIKNEIINNNGYKIIPLNKSKQNSDYLNIRGYQFIKSV